jgi:hypothetical protein
VEELIRIEELDRQLRRRVGFSLAYDELVKRFDLVEIGIDPDEVLERSKESSGGRENPW